MNIGIVSTWFERGASYVSKQFENALAKEHSIFIYARCGEKYAIGDPMWDKANVTWGLRRIVPFPDGGTVIDKKDFIKWLKKNRIEIILFNEQRWHYPMIWCDELKIPTVGYVDYYKKDTIPLFSVYNALICNTKRHYSVFNWHPNSYYIPWGTDVSVFKPKHNDFKLVNDNVITFFHSSGMDPYRKGTDILLLAADKLNEKFKLIIHTQIDLRSYFDNNINLIIDRLSNAGVLEIISKTVSAPGLYHLGDVYVYPSRLEGIGLTVAESMACGLVPLVTNNGPMNEFVDDSIGYLINVSDYYSRHDAYYWPECNPDVNSLMEQMNGICNNMAKIAYLKEANYRYANEHLNWELNSKKVLDVIKNIKYKRLDDTVRKRVLDFEESGFRKITRMYMSNYLLFSFMMKVLVKLLILIGVKKNRRS